MKETINICLTIDVEWAPEGVLDWLCLRLKEAGIRATLFATDTPRFDFGVHETGIHPNPFRPEAVSMLDEIRRLRGLFPAARGLRMHRLAWDSGLESALEEAGIDYVSNILIPGQAARPFRLGPHAVHFPIYYMDHHEMIRPELFRPSFSLEALAMKKGTIHVLDFHPVMLFSNCPDEQYYRAEVHPHYRDMEELRSRRFSGRGCDDLFGEVLACVRRPDFHFMTLAEAFEQEKQRETRV